MLIILCGKTAVGKDTYQNMLLERNPNLRRAISHTTRPKRIQEVDGREYYFISRTKFSQLQENRAFIETRTYNTVENGEPSTWSYGLTYEEADGDGAAIAIVDHKGIKEILSKKQDLEVRVVYLTAPDSELRKRSEERLDESAEFERRLADDKKEFVGIEEIANLIIYTKTDDHEENLQEIESLFGGIT